MQNCKASNVKGVREIEIELDKLCQLTTCRQVKKRTLSEVMVGNVAKLKEQLRHSNQHKFMVKVSHSKVKSIGSMNMMNQEV